MSLFQRLRAGARAALAYAQVASGRILPAIKKTEPASPVVPAPDAGNPRVPFTKAEAYRLRQRRISPNLMAKIMAVTAHYKPRPPRKRAKWSKPHQGKQECARRVRQMREFKCIDRAAIANYWITFWGYER